MLKVLVDATPIAPRPSGIGIYAINLIIALIALQNKENFQLEIYYQPRLKQWIVGNLSLPHIIPQNVPIHLLPLPVTLTNLLARIPNNLITSYGEGYLQQPDLVHGTDHFVYPCRHSFKVMTIHDLSFIKYPAYASWIVRNTYYQRLKQCLQWTDLVLTVSESSKRDIVEYLDVAPKRIYITPQASRYSWGYLNQNLKEKLAKSSSYDFSQPYLLFVSTIEPRKNILNLLQAFNYLKSQAKIEHRLVLIGQKGLEYKSIFAAIEASPWREYIHHLDYLSDELVALFYSEADLFVYPSYYEGFGLPVLEAMSLGAPVVAANTSSLPEVAGDAALLVDPKDWQALADAIMKILDDGSFRSQLIQKGKERSKLFSWERTARETLNAYQSLFNKKL